MSSYAVVQAWLDKIGVDDRKWVMAHMSSLAIQYKTGTVKPLKLAMATEAALAKVSSVIYLDRQKRSAAVEDSYVTTLSVALMTIGDFNGTFLRFDELGIQKKTASWASHGVFSYVHRHAWERLVERAGASEPDFREAMLKLALVSQAFNSAHLLGHDPKMPLLLPFRDGLFLGQTDMLTEIPPGLLVEFGKNGMSKRDLAQPKIAIFLGNPPRAMIIRTFIGGGDGLTKAKTRTHALLSEFFTKHDALLRRFSRLVLFDLQTKDLVHALTMSAMNVGQEFLAEIDKVQGKPIREVPALDPLVCAFRDEGDRAAVRAMLAEYQGLLEDEAIKSVLASSAKHVR